MDFSCLIKEAMWPSTRQENDTMFFVVNHLFILWQLFLVCGHFARLLAGKTISSQLNITFDLHISWASCFYKKLPNIYQRFDCFPMQIWMKVYVKICLSKIILERVLSCTDFKIVVLLFLCSNRQLGNMNRKLKHVKTMPFELLLQICISIVQIRFTFNPFKHNA